MSNTWVTFDGNEALNQFTDNPLEFWIFIILIVFLLLIGLFIYIKFIKKSEWDILNIKTRDIKTKWDVIIGKDNIKNK